MQTIEFEEMFLYYALTHLIIIVKFTKWAFVVLG